MVPRLFGPRQPGCYAAGGRPTGPADRQAARPACDPSSPPSSISSLAQVVIAILHLCCLPHSLVGNAVDDLCIAMSAGAWEPATRSRRFLSVGGFGNAGNADLGLRGLFALVSFDEGQPVAVEHVADVDEENPIHQAFK